MIKITKLLLTKLMFPPNITSAPASYVNKVYYGCPFEAKFNYCNFLFYLIFFIYSNLHLFNLSIYWFNAFFFFIYPIQISLSIECIFLFIQFNHCNFWFSFVFLIQSCLLYLFNLIFFIVLMSSFFVFVQCNFFLIESNIFIYSFNALHFIYLKQSVLLMQCNLHI